jgi:DNA-binding MarR family transcriptional regulator
MKHGTSEPLADPRPVAFGTVFIVAHHLDLLGDVALAPLGLTTKQWLLLAIIERAFAGRRPTLSEAAAAYGSSRQNVKAMARALEAAGYLRLVPDAVDGRATRLEPTARVGVFATPAWRAREAAFFEFAFGGLPAEDVARLAGLLQRWLSAVAAAPNPGDAPAAVPGPDPHDAAEQMKGAR